MTNTGIQVVRSNAVALPQPREAIAIRVAVAGDLPFIDALQKQHSRMVGWFPRQQLETNIRRGQVLIAEGIRDLAPGTSENQGDAAGAAANPSAKCLMPGASPLGYCISSDRYLKHDDLGIIYQLNVAPSHQRGLIGATLIKAVFDRVPYGCKLFCCWCAQDLEANHFWESLGFVPLAFRTGGRSTGGTPMPQGKRSTGGTPMPQGKRSTGGTPMPQGKRSTGGTPMPRIHIFWQRRIREGDRETPYWFPSETTGGSLRENRLVLPIPPGTHWSDAKPAVLPGIQEALNALPEGEAKGSRGKPKRKSKRPEKSKNGLIPNRPTNGLWFAPPEPTAEEKKAAKQAATKDKPRRKNDPKLIAAARELRDRYMEQINAGLLLPPGAFGKYDVSRSLEAAPTVLERDGVVVVEQHNLLDAA